MLLCSFLCLAVVGVFAFLKAPLNYNKTISWHVAQSKSVSMIAKVLLPMAGLLLIVWSVASRLQVITTVLVVIIGIGFVILGLATYGRSRRGDILHDVAAWLSALIALVLVITMMISRGSMFDFCMLGVMLLCIYFARYAKSMRRYGSLLIAETTFFISFYAYLLII